VVLGHAASSSADLLVGVFYDLCKGLRQLALDVNRYSLRVVPYGQAERHLSPQMVVYGVISLPESSVHIVLQSWRVLG
jgi:hypothetical protein